MSVGQWDSDYKGGGGGKVSETPNKERGARVLRLQSSGGTRELRLDRGGEGISKGAQFTEEGSVDSYNPIMMEAI